MSSDLKLNVAGAAIAITGTPSVASPGSPLNVALRYQFVGFAFVMMFLVVFFRQYTKNQMWETSSRTLNQLLYDMVKLVFSLGFYLPSAYSLGREAWSLENSLMILKPIVYYNVIATLAFKILEPWQRCKIGSYTGAVSDPAQCRNSGRGGGLTKFTDTFIAPILMIISSTVIYDIDSSSGMGTVSPGFRSESKKPVDEEKDTASRGNVTNLNFFDSIENGVAGGGRGVFTVITLGLIFGLLHRALMSPRDVVAGSSVTAV